jgi:Cof subfamily protein (haloacid dehalogenase superfamily)
VTQPIRLIAIDIDGTLLDSQIQIPAANLDALRRAREAGIEIILVTGRRHSFAMPIAQMVGFPFWLISSNGAVTKSTDGELFHIDFLPAATLRRMLAWMNDFRDSAVITFNREDRGALVLENRAGFYGSISRWMEKNAEFIAEIVPLELAIVADPIQAMFCGSVARMRAAEARLAAGGMQNEITVLKTEYEKRDLGIIDVLNCGCSKGHAVERWAARCGIPREQVMAIGDNFNDVEMLEFAGTPVIMGNACSELLRAGYNVTRSNDECGVAAAIEEFALHKAAPAATG